MKTPALAPMLLICAVVAACDDAKDPVSIRPGPAVRLVALDDRVRSGVMGAAADVAPTVLALDANNLPVPGTAVDFAVHSGGGSVSKSQVVTDTRGEASVTWVLGAGFAPQILRAAVASVDTVAFEATAVVPDSGLASFSHADPANDTMPTADAGMPLAHDLVALEARFKPDSLIFTFRFNRPVAPGFSFLANSVGGFIEIDIDDNPNTGERPFVNYFGGSANMGVEWAISLFETTATTALLYSLTDVTEVPATFSGGVITVRVPLALLADDDGSYTIAGVIGTEDRPTDIAPNSGAILARISAAPTATAAPLGAVRAPGHAGAVTWGRSALRAPR